MGKPKTHKKKTKQSNKKTNINKNKNIIRINIGHHAKTRRNYNRTSEHKQTHTKPSQQQTFYQYGPTPYYNPTQQNATPQLPAINFNPVFSPTHNPTFTPTTNPTFTPTNNPTIGGGGGFVPAPHFQYQPYHPPEMKHHATTHTFEHAPEFKPSEPKVETKQEEEPTLADMNCKTKC